MNFGTSIFKREAKDAQEVIDHLRNNGWEVTGTLGNRLTYMENSSFNLTIVDGVKGTLVVPSGPIRGRLFGNSGAMFNNTSVIGASASKGDGEEDINTQQKAQQHT